MFRREQHRKVLTLLNALNSEILSRCRFFFGGGTRIRFPVEIEGNTIRVELIREARISLEPGVRPSWSPVDCLAVPDCYAEKVLANSDRWADRQFLSRDLIDLAILRSQVGPIPKEAWDKVERAYKTAGQNDLLKAVTAFTEDGAHQQRCFQGLQIDNPAHVLEGISQLRQDIDRSW